MPYVWLVSNTIWQLSILQLIFWSHLFPDILVEALLLTLCVPCQIQLQVGFDFLNLSFRLWEWLYIPSASLDPYSSFSTFSFSYLSVFRSSLLICASLVPSLVDFLFVRMDHSWFWRRWPLKVNWLSWTPLLSTILFHEILPSSSPRGLNLLSWSSSLRSCFLPLFPLPCPKILNSTTS